ncbi:Protein Flattop homolog [Eumeta japonica]|uniref:Cilia- and flagella-associated protein 126 n=1 Tax=Eumeta variegata TaxID=151549 RepID=A0A4C1VAE3_EUMVA|nr:Protein Flattop homolog [Eumeta japonica]
MECEFENEIEIENENKIKIEYGFRIRLKSVAGIGKRSHTEIGTEIVTERGIVIGTSFNSRMDVNIKGEFNAEKRPKPLCNWEVPRWAPTRPRPADTRPPCKPIVDDRGHFLPGVPRGTSRCFGNYVGTWDLPRRITRQLAEIQPPDSTSAGRLSALVLPSIEETDRLKTIPMVKRPSSVTAEELSRQPPPGRYKDWLQPRVQRPKAAPPVRLRGQKADREKGRDARRTDEKFEEDLPTQETEKSYANEQQSENNTGKEEKEPERIDQEKECDLFDRDNKKKPVDQSGHGPYIPGSETEPEKRHDSYSLLEKNAIEEIHGPQEEVTEKFWRKVAENAKKNELQEKEVGVMREKDRENFKLPVVNVVQNFEFARKMRVGNLEHQPLPDTMGYRNLTKVGEHRDSDIVVKPYAIGWKGYGASGPTCCTKMRVHRPKTCDATKSENVEENKLRPSTSAPDLGRKYKKPMSLMDLAICWDYRPDDPQQEPRPPKHVDGSNGSKAPAVFTMVHTPKDTDEDCIKSGHSNPIFNQNRIVEDVGRHPVPYFEKDVTKEKRKESCDVQHCSQHDKNKNDHNKRDSKSGSNTRRSSVQSGPKAECDGIHGCGTPSETSRKSSKDYSTRPEKLAQIKEAWSNDKYDLNRNRPSLESYEKTSLAQGKLHQSSPNDSKLSRRSTKETIVSNNNEKHKYCTSCNNNCKSQVESKNKEDYKFAFKAGNPNSAQNSNSNDSKNFKIPKLRHPYSKKSYSIPTLAPPFSVWKDSNSSGYPEHWRLASIYQHAYKPPEQRRKPLIASIYE